MSFKIKDIITMAAAPFFVFMAGYYLDQFTAAYQILEWPNRLMHFLGGLSITVPIFIVLKWAKANKFISTSSHWVDFLLLVMGAMFVATFWEYHEYIHDTYFPSLHLAQPSVDDTMKDMVMGMLGSITFVLGWWILGFFKKPNIPQAIVNAKKKGRHS